MQQQAELLGLKAMASRAIRLQVQFVSLDFVFRVCPTFYTKRSEKGCIAHDARREMPVAPGSA